MAQPLLVWDPAMLRYDLGGAHPLHPLRWELTWALADALAVTADLEITSPIAATDAELGAVHTPAYIRAVREASAAGFTGPIGHGLGTADNPAFLGMHEAAALIAGGSITAARAIARGEADRAVAIGGGLHHAMADHASGFCVYNDAALAIAALLSEGVRKIAYVDVDVHHGDGVQRAFYDDPRVLTISLHETPMALWPGTGYLTESGHGAAAGSSVNIPLPVGTGDADWLRAFHAVVPSLLREFRPEVLVTQHGADSHRADPLADLELTVDGQVESYRLLRDLAGEVAGGRWLALGGGGYSLVQVIPRAWTHLLALAADRDLDPATATPLIWRQTAAAARPGEPVPETMSDTGAPAVFSPWDGEDTGPLDVMISKVRGEIFPLYGLDPFDPRD